MTTVMEALSVPTVPKMSLEEFIAWYPNQGQRYELHQGVVKPLPLPTGVHELITSFLAEELSFLIRSQQLPYRVARIILVKSALAGLVQSDYQ